VDAPHVVRGIGAVSSARAAAAKQPWTLVRMAPWPVRDERGGDCVRVLSEHRAAQRMGNVSSRVRVRPLRDGEDVYALDASVAV